jgi:hypothetical protein
MQTFYLVITLASLNIGTNVERVRKGALKENMEQLLMYIGASSDKRHIFISSGVRLWLQLMVSMPSFILGHV